MSKQIPLTQNQFAIVDDIDYEYLSQFNWYLHSEGYAIREIWNGGNRVRIRMHREIMGTPEGMDTDHINNNRLDNRRSNLRICTRTQNLQNSLKRSNNTSVYKGVSFFKPIGKWRAYITLNKKTKTLGYFESEIDAAKAYNRAAAEMFGDFAKLNEV